MELVEMSKKNKIIALQGVPSSGKSTYAREFVKGKKDWVIVNRDSIRDGRGDYWIPEQEQYISKIEEFQIEEALRNGLNVIIDATNLNPKTIKKWEDLAQKHNVALEFKEFKISYKEAIERDSKRERSVGKKVIRDFFMKYYPEEIAGFKDEREIYYVEDERPTAIICDLDGTVALRTDRSPFDYSKIPTDIFDPRMKRLLKTYIDMGIMILFVTGREDIDNCKELTTKWLEDNFCEQYTQKMSGKSPKWELIMRKNGDHRSDDVTKKELYNNSIKDYWNILCVFEDRDRVVKMWREEGLLCNQVYYGDF